MLNQQKRSDIHHVKKILSRPLLTSSHYSSVLQEGLAFPQVELPEIQGNSSVTVVALPISWSSSWAICSSNFLDSFRQSGFGNWHRKLYWQWLLVEAAAGLHQDCLGHILYSPNRPNGKLHWHNCRMVSHLCSRCHYLREKRNWETREEVAVDTKHRRLESVRSKKWGRGWHPKGFAKSGSEVEQIPCPYFPWKMHIADVHEHPPPLCVVNPGLKIHWTPSFRHGCYSTLSNEAF